MTSLTRTKRPSVRLIDTEADRLPADVVTMHSTVEFEDAANETRRTVQLVYPGDADISAGHVSLLTPVDTGLIGLSVGHGID